MRARGALATVVALAALVACSGRGASTRGASAGSAAASGAGSAGLERAAGPHDARPADAPPDAGPASPPSTALTLAQARALLFPAGDGPGCDDDGTAPGAAHRCLLRAAYASDADAAALAIELYERTGAIAGLGRDEQMAGGYRGTIHLVPRLPIGVHRVHLQRVRDALIGLEAFLAGLATRGGATSPPASPTFRWRDVQLRFVESVGRKTPSAYASGFDVTYNVMGSLLTTAGGVADTMIHELFHSNDGARGDWSARALRAEFDGIVAACPKLERTCLAPYAPGTTTVKGGTYYAFQPNNGDAVHEYGAELALRYVREHRDVLAGRTVKARFKCGPAVNARTWRLLADEFFAGIDLVPACA